MKLSRPLPIPAASSQQRLVTANLVTLRKNSTGRGMDEVVPTLTAGADHHTLVECTLSPEVEAGALRCAAFLMKYNGIGENVIGMDEPVSTVTTKNRLALVTVWIDGDIHLRMLQPHELYTAQGFPSSYKITHGHDGRKFTKSEQVFMCGNSVSPPPMAAIAAANDPWRGRDRQKMAA